MGECLDDGLWNIGGVGEERAEEAQGAELHGQTQSERWFSSHLQKLEVWRLEGKVMPELLGHGIGVEAPVALEMVIGEKCERHNLPRLLQMNCFNK